MDSGQNGYMDSDSEMTDSLSHGSGVTSQPFQQRRLPPFDRHQHVLSSSLPSYNSDHMLRQVHSRRAHNNSKSQASTMTQYRSGSNDCPQSPTSPLSQHSYSPSQSPGAPSSNLSSSPFSELYSQQQQQHPSQTSILQQQFEQFNMMPEIPLTTPNNAMDIYGVMPPASSSHFQFLPHNMVPITSNVDSYQQQKSGYFSRPGHDPTSQSFNAQGSPVSPHQIPPSPTNQFSNISPTTQGNNKIPDIVLTGVCDDPINRQDLNKGTGSSFSCLSEFFDQDVFSLDEALKVGLNPLELEELQMLTDSNVITDPGTEESFRLDQL